MAYIGSSPTSGSFTLLDSISTSASASFTMQKNSVNFEPQSANHMIVSLNGTIQAPVSSFTVSGSTITFASALTSSDVIDFILVLGNVNDVGTATTVVDSAITKNKLDLISTSGSPGLTVKGDGSSENGTIALNCSQNSHAVKISGPAHSAGQSYELILPTGNVTADKFLKVASVSGSGTTGIGQLSFGDAGGIDAYWSASRNSGQSVAQNTSTTILFNVVTVATGITNTLTSNGRITIASGQEGWYVVTAINRYADGPTSGKEKLSIYYYDNSAGTTETLAYAEMNTSGTYDTKVATGLKYLDTNDYVYVSVNQNNDSSANFIGGNGTAFMGFKIA